MIALLLLRLAVPAWAAPDLILTGGKIFLGPGRYAAAVAITGNRISAVGSAAEIAALKGPETRVIALKGRAATPGFHDSDVHFFKGALSLTLLDVGGAANVPEIQKRLVDYAAKNPGDGWLIGRGWDQTLLPEGAYPTRLDIDAVISTRPVALIDAEGNKIWLNTEGLKRANISSKTTKVNKSGILVDAKGQPTGVLLDEAMGLGHRVLPKLSRQDKLAALRQALAIAREAGITSIEVLPGVDDVSPEEQLEFWRELYKAREVTLRYFIYGRLEDPDGFLKLKRKAKDIPRDRLDFVGLTATLDGSVADRTAALAAPYFDEPKEDGSLRHKSLFLNAMVRKAHQLGFQAALETAGDKAVRQALDACQKSQEKARQEDLILPPHPCKLEHIELVDREDIPRFAALGAVASMQPSHALFDSEAQNYYPNRLGERVRYVFPWKSLQNAGALITFGSVWPVVPLAPRAWLFAATTRETTEGKPAGGWIPQEKIALEQAVEHATADPARAIGRGDILGSIAPGRLADIIVFDRDLFSTADLNLLQTEVDMTIFDGKIVFERK